MIGDELVIRTQKQGAEIYELIPSTKLSGDFPMHFVEEYVHWLNVATGDIEFRPINYPWKSTTKNWHLLYSLDAPTLMRQEHTYMLDIRGRTASMIGSILSPLESSDRIDITFEPKSGILAHLPRLKLDFFVNGNNKLECRQFRGAVVDTNRNIGTMYGLENRLVLRQNASRSIIIPYGEVEYQKHENHTRVHINTEGPGRSRVQYHVYNIDVKLGRLVGNGSLASHLYKIYLHAVTAHCMPDPLTNRTGTEEALDNLRSAATWSFQRLQPNEIEMLRLIASLTSTRVYYPKHFKRMQSVRWNNISPIAQHEEFNEIVTSIFNHATQFHVFREDGEVPTYHKSKSDIGLLRRSAIRNANHRRHEFGGSLSAPGTVKDTSYVARDTLICGVGGARVWSVARAVESWSPDLDISPQLMGVLQLWQNVSGVNGEIIRVGYEPQWLNPKLAKVWGSVYDACRHASRRHSTYRLMFFLCTLAYSTRLEPKVIGSLLAFATVSQFRSLTPPQYPSYNLTNGFTPDQRQLIGIVESCAISYGLSQEATLAAISGENTPELESRRFSAYKRNLELQSKQFVTSLLSQWPCASPNTPCDVDYRLLDSLKAMGGIRSMFDSWYRNRQFQKHIAEVQRVLNTISPVRCALQSYSFQPCIAGARQVVATVSFKDLLHRVAPTLPVSHPGTIPPPRSENDLNLLLLGFKRAHSREFEKHYADSMLESLQALESQAPSVETFLDPSASTLEAFVSQCKDHLDAVFQKIRETLSPFGDVEHLISMAGLWPCISPISLLRQLATNTPNTLSSPWKKVLVSYGKAIAGLQRAERLLAYGTSRGKDVQSEFHSEVRNIGHQEWDPVEHPDWLLIEIENNFLVRPVQNRVACEMISPTSGKNQVLKLLLLPRYLARSFTNVTVDPPTEHGGGKVFRYCTYYRCFSSRRYEACPRGSLETTIHPNVSLAGPKA